MFPMWLYALVSAAIAVTAFAIGQAAPGMGVPFAAAASTMWVAYAVYRQQKVRRRS